MKSWVPVVLWGSFCAAIIVCADGGFMRGAFEQINRWPLADKAIHFLFIGLLAFLLNRALRWRAVSAGRETVQWGGLIIAAATMLEELSQLWIPLRHCDWGDMAANLAGVLCAELAARRCGRNRRRIAAPPGGS